MPANYVTMHRGYGLYDNVFTEHGEDLKAALESADTLRIKYKASIWPSAKAIIDVVDLDDPERGSFSCLEDGDDR